MEIVVILVVIGVVLGVGLALVAPRLRSRGPELEPPARPSVGQGTAVEEGPEVDGGDVDVLEPPVEEAPPEVVAPVRPSFRERLSKARGTVSGYLGSILSRSAIDDETWDDLEEALIRADVGVGPATEVLDAVRARVKADGIESPEVLLEAVKDEVKARLHVDDRTLHSDEGETNVWLFVGVNGVGKTTTIGKLGKREAEVGRTVVMAAGDTFRAAAAEQLGTWAERCGATLVRGAEGADPSSIVFDGITKAASMGADLLLADTAGRLHNKTNLMDELRKVRRVAGKEPGHVTEVLLVIDATTGQNGLAQARVFTEAVEVTGVVLTKLDGSAKGGIVLAIQADLGIPVKLVGLGETADDLVAFDPDEFVDALFATD
ncbi:signal recognition particle-docking protein FtsY [Iamia majanohamensis]|uniref:Signal recognition particle receptor FtsY n=1 Tax=Iamia majanohamensis TaxID=467976 RepID=A0AAF0BUI4_9ACTN|nr:signal recognition particle-docking protein FtsY [Iamia majanohamensis]WCO65454.1 signal recognition particle-docking protein FtsY [Iamia majanohamensis]